MASKIVVNYPGSLGNDALESKKQSVADALGVCPEDVILLPGLSVSVVELPDALTKAREKADKEKAKEEEKAQAQQESAEVQAIAEAADRLREESTEQHSADARREVAGEPRPAVTPAPTSPHPPVLPAAGAAEAKAPAKAEPADYESWTAEDLHAEAAKRELPGRSGLAKADLVKLIQKADRDTAKADEKPRAAHGDHGHKK